MSPLKCLVVDDEELARTLLKTYIDRLPYLEIIGSAKNPLEALDLLHNVDVDLIFLDIQMPEMTGLDFLRVLKSSPKVVLTTAYKDYAIESYELDVVDYLLKPFSFERFLKAVNKVELALKKANSPLMPTQIIQESNSPDWISVKSSHKIHRIYYNDILYIEGMREYVAFHTAIGRILTLASLKSLESKLPKDQFLRVHKSYIVSIRNVDSLDGNQLILGGSRIPIGASYKEKIKGQLFDPD